MQAIRTHVAGIDVHKDVLAITILIGNADIVPEVIQFESKTFTSDLIAVGTKFLELGVTQVAMESTGVYWKPLYNVWQPLGIDITVAQAAHVKNVPGRKTDMNDSHWLAELHRHGLIRASFIPEDKFQRIRLLSRHRTNLVHDLGRIKNRIQKTLQDGNIKYSSVVSDVFGKSGLMVLRAIADGVTDAGQLSSKVTTKIKRKEEVRKALSNCLTTEHIFLIKELMNQYDHIESRRVSVDNELQDRIQPYRHLVDKLKQVPGIDEILAISILSETTDDMSNFKDERAFAAWAGVASGNNESAGKKKRSKCRKGNPHLRRTLVQVAQNAKLKRKSFYRSKYNKLKFRLGSANKAKVAIANRIARTIYKIIAGDSYRDIGYLRGDPHENKVRKLVGQLKALGVNIRHESHQMIYSVSDIKVDSTGVLQN